MCTDHRFNDPLYATTITQSDLILEITDSTKSSLFSVTVPAGDLTAASVDTATELATFANADARLNGTNVTLPGGPVANWIVWKDLSNGYFPDGVTVEVFYDLTLLDAAQKAVVLGEKAGLRIQYLSNIQSIAAAPYSRNHNVVDADLSIGFYSYKGTNSQVDRAAGDRNNAALISFPSTATPTTYEAYSAARGLRWVFSSPLTEEHVGSFVHLTKPHLYRFDSVLDSQDDSAAASSVPPVADAWTSGWPRQGDEPQIFNVTDIFRINRCPNTGHLLLGGDCEVYTTELISINGRRGHTIMYSPLSVMGAWPDTVTGLDPADGSLNLPIMYSLQPIAREKIVSVNPRMMSSNRYLGHSGENPSGLGPDGMQAAISIRDHVDGPGSDPKDSVSLGLSEPWLLFNRHNATRTRLAENRTVANTYINDEYGIIYNDQPELFNSNNPDPFTTLTALADSDYSWTPAGEWWQLVWPKAYQDSWIYDSSVPPPTLTVDLTETFTQAMQPGGGLNSPYPGKQPKGARLTRIWVNFGVWGEDILARNVWPGMPFDPAASDIQMVLDKFHMCFNLVLEIPGSQARQEAGVFNLPLNTGTAGFPFGDRAPSASYTHPDNSGPDRFAGGTIVVPLYVNREAGDLMPNVIERFVDSGPKAVWNSSGVLGTDPSPDWALGHYEFGLGAGHDGDTDYWDFHNFETLISNASNPVIWGGIDFALAGEGGPFLTPAEAVALASPFPRSSRLGGGLRSAFTSGLAADGTAFKKTNPHSLSAAAMTGIVVTHAGKYPNPKVGSAGAFRDLSGARLPGGETCGHAFTIALTPIGDDWETPKDGGGTRIAVDTSTSVSSGSESLAFLGRVMEQGPNALGFDKTSPARPFKVGNWLDHILNRYGIATPSGSMLPPGARVKLQISASPGPGAKVVIPNAVNALGPTGSGCWVGGVKVGFEVETADGTAYTTNVNNLGEDGS
jgi:hypothetical protein